MKYKEMRLVLNYTVITNLFIKYSLCIGYMAAFGDTESIKEILEGISLGGQHSSLSTLSFHTIKISQKIKVQNRVIWSSR